MLAILNYILRNIEGSDKESQDKAGLNYISRVRRFLIDAVIIMTLIIILYTLTITLKELWSNLDNKDTQVNMRKNRILWL